MTAKKLTDMTVDDLKILIREVVAAELQKWSNQLTTKDLNNSGSKRPYLNSEGQYILLERTPEEIARHAQAIRDIFAEWEREDTAEKEALGIQPYVNSNGCYILPERTPEEQMQRNKALISLLDEWVEECDAEEQRETYECLNQISRVSI